MKKATSGQIEQAKIMEKYLKKLKKVDLNKYYIYFSLFYRLLHPNEKLK